MLAQAPQDDEIALDAPAEVIENLQVCFCEPFLVFPDVSVQQLSHVSIKCFPTAKLSVRMVVEKSRKTCLRRNNVFPESYKVQQSEVCTYVLVVFGCVERHCNIFCLPNTPKSFLNCGTGSSSVKLRHCVYRLFVSLNSIRLAAILASLSWQRTVRSPSNDILSTDRSRTVF